MDIQNTASEAYYIADTSAGAEKLKIIRQKAHSGTGKKILCCISGFLKRHIRVSLQKFCHGNHDGSLSYGYLSGIDSRHIIPAGCSDQGTLIRTGGYGRISQIENLSLRVFLMNGIEDLDKIFR